MSTLCPYLSHVALEVMANKKCASDFSSIAKLLVSFHSNTECENVSSPAGNRTPVSRVTGGDTYHYTTEDIYNSCRVHHYY